jgi:mannose-6-phosphate isomerase-like protein (cupin superfamily)
MYFVTRTFLPCCEYLTMKPQSVHNFKEWFETLHTTAQSQVAMMRLNPGQESGDSAESHLGSDQVLLVLEGTLQGEVAGECISLSKGEFITIPADTPHRFYNSSVTPALTFNVYAPPAYPTHTCG